MNINKWIKGLATVSNTQDTQGQVTSNTRRLKFSTAEFISLSKRQYVEPSIRTKAQNTDLHQIISYLLPSHEHSVVLVQDVERIKALAPEIGQAENIIISSIVSPNDLQDADPNIFINPFPELTESCKTNIEELLQDYFIREHQLGTKITKWCSEALFRSGAAVTLILPESTLAKLSGHLDVDETGAGKEEYNPQLLEDQYLQLLKKDVYPSHLPTTDIISDKKIIHDRNKSANESTTRIGNEKLENIMSYLQQSVPSMADMTDIPDKEYNKYLLGLENITAKITTELESGDTLFLSETPEVLRFGSKVRQMAKNGLNKTVLNQYNQREDVKHYSQNKMEDIIDLTPFIEEGDINKTAPFCIDIPSEAVIPICIPGSKENKLGYFILIDAFGQPIEASKYLNTMLGCSTSGRVQSAYTAMFGNKPTESGIQTNMFNGSNRIGNPWDLQQNAITRVFDYVLDEMLRKKLNKVGLRDVDLGQYNSIATCMFYRLLEKKRTTLVFVPTQLINYVAFDYREDGAGKSKLESAMFILSLRVTFLVANMMAMMRNAVARKEVEISFDEKETQFESVLDEVKQAMNEKYRFSLSSDPSTIAQAINTQNTIIKMAPHPNAPGFNISSSDTQSQVPKADNELLDTLNSWFVTVLGVPHSVLNQLSEAEFSRSVATTNLFFSKMIRNYQSIVCGFGQNYIQTVIRFYPTLQKQILDLLKGSTVQIARDKTDDILENDTTLEVVPNTATDIDSTTTTTNESLSKLLHTVISNVGVSLPAPNIAPDKAQYEVFKDYISLIEDLVNNLFPDNFVGTDSDLSGAFGAIKSMFKSVLTKEYATKTGLSGAMDVPNLDEFLLKHSDTIRSTLRTVRNLNKGLERDKSIQTTSTEPDESDSTTTEQQSTDTNDYTSW